MQDIRENLRKASKQVSENCFEEAIQTLEQVVADSKNQDYVGGKFCAYKHLGDLYCKMVLVSWNSTCRNGTRIRFVAFEKRMVAYSYPISANRSFEKQLKVFGPRCVPSRKMTHLWKRNIQKQKTRLTPSQRNNKSRHRMSTIPSYRVKSAPLFHRLFSLIGRKPTIPSSVLAKRIHCDR